MEIKKIEEPFSICKVKDYSKVDLQDTFSFVAKTDEELSLVCLTQSVPDNTTEREDGWKAMRNTRRTGLFTHRHPVGNINRSGRKQDRHLRHIYLQHRLYSCERREL